MDYDDLIEKLACLKMDKIDRKLLLWFNGINPAEPLDSSFSKNEDNDPDPKNGYEMRLFWYKTKYLAGRILRAWRVNSELSSSQGMAVYNSLKKLQSYDLVVRRQYQESRMDQEWRITDLGLAVARAYKKELSRDEPIEWSKPKIIDKL